MNASEVKEYKAGDRLQRLPDLLDAEDALQTTLQTLTQGGRVMFEGVWGSVWALLAAQLARHVPSTLLVVMPSQKLAESCWDDLELFAPGQARFFPAWDTTEDERVLHDEAYGDRLRVLKELLTDQPPTVIVASMPGLLQPVPSRRHVEEATRRLAVGDQIDLDSFCRWLVEHGFHRTSAVDLPGEFAFRGGILDVFAPDWFQPIRIEFFDNEVESIRQFDVKSQRSLESLASMDLTVMPAVHRDQEHLSAFLTDRAWVMFFEPEEALKQGEIYRGRLNNPDEVHHPQEVLAACNHLAQVTAQAMAAGTESQRFHYPAESVQRFQGDLAHIRSEMDQLSQGQQVTVVCPTEGEIERVAEILQPTAVAQDDRLHFAVGLLSEGLLLPGYHELVLSVGELFRQGRSDLRRGRRRHLGKAIDSFLDLKEGDLVVHLSHGIGRYRGLRLLDRDGQVEEFLELEFFGGTRIYVPATKIGLVQKYVGGSKKRPTLAKIGGKQWVRQKQAAQRAVEDLASEMLDLQAMRLARSGIAFGADSEWQREFDAAFPYQETEDQVQAIQAIKADMESQRPMDRLLCGDVGYGKTEVSMRAAFKAVENGYQVAVLVPTTILAEQHYHTFRERMAEFPVEIAKLSRFVSTADQKKNIEGLKTGRVDIVIGTHRLASKDVDFYNLGLLIIDEEQRFGVQVKERLKSIRSSVDVLTMTATPIPRTLHMSLVGLRDISNLETPPEERLAVNTKVARFDDQLIRNAVLRELNRGGQIYFVHNRVNDIGGLAHRLRQVVPEATMDIGHGQMPEGDLERVMVHFIEHEFDLLLATTIVESGLDIPNANTIFVDEADRYGLADLHQLRGRVGRYNRQAYCYMLVSQGKHVTPDAARRLRAIEEYSEMGAGFAIAMRDLEIRGAGNLLGTQQSGHIAAVGYELYCQLLETAVRKRKSLPAKLDADVDIDLPGAAYLPAEYVPDLRSKIDLYRRFSRVAHFQELADLGDELEDRFGKPPISVELLMERTELRLEAAVWGIEAIFVEGQYLVFRFGPASRVQELAKQSRRPLRIVNERTVYLPLVGETELSFYALAKSVLSPPT